MNKPFEVGIMLNSMSLCRRVGLNHRGVFKGETVKIKGKELIVTGVTEDGYVTTDDNEKRLAKDLNLSWKCSRNVIVPDMKMREFLLSTSAY